MPRCQAVNGDHMTGKQKMSYFIIPNPGRLRNDPLKYAKEREKATKWFHNNGRGWRSETFQISKEQSTLREALSSRNVPRGHYLTSLMGWMHSKKLLKSDVVPTIFSHRPAGKKRPASIQRLENRVKTEVIM